MISPYVRRLRLAQELRRLREEAGLRHEDLAKRIGENRAKISRLENGHIPPDTNDVINFRPGSASNGMHRARGAGAHHVTVACMGAPGHPQARGLYHSVGFQELTRDVPLVKTGG